jgi:AcrR family transcriptional regulator
VNQVGQIKRRDREANRELILETFARMVVDEGIETVSIQRVADRAGLAHRTVYRHFSSRQELIDQLAEWLDQRLLERGGIYHLDSIDDLPCAVAKNARLFDDEADLVKALVLATWSGSGPAAAQQQRTRDFAKFVSSVTVDLNPTEAAVFAAIVRYLASSRTWFALREESGLTGAESGPVLAWAIQTLLDALRDPSFQGISCELRKGSSDG